MASSAASNGWGSSITFSSGFFAQITRISWSGIQRVAIPTSHMGTAAAGAGIFGNATFIVGKIVDPGELTVEMSFNPDTLPPIASAAESTTVTMGDSSTPATWVGSAFMTSFEPSLSLDEKNSATAKIKFSGGVTRTAGT